VTKSRTCRSFNGNVTQSLSVVCAQSAKTLAFCALVAVEARYQLQSHQLQSSPCLFICLRFANSKSDLDFSSAILNLLKISYLFILLNFRWDRIVRINFGLSGFAQSETTRITAQRIARGTFGLRIFGDKWHAPFILSPNEQCQSTEGINSKESNQGNHRMASSFIDQMMDS